MYTLENLEKDIDNINKELKAIRLDRGKRYGDKEDTLANVREADPDKSYRAAYIAAYECLRRIKNVFDVPIDEIDMAGFENATDDLINYAYYIKILFRQRRQR